MLNNIVLMGRLTADPELRHTANGIPVSGFTLAVERSYVKADSERITDFIDVSVWRSTAEFVCKYFHKGQLVAVQGPLHTRLYQDKDGNKRKAFEVVASEVHFADSKKDSGNTRPETHNNDQLKSENKDLFSNGDNEDFKQMPMDDDLPF